MCFGCVSLVVCFDCVSLMICFGCVSLVVCFGCASLVMCFGCPRLMVCFGCTSLMSVLIARVSLWVFDYKNLVLAQVWCGVLLAELIWWGFCLRKFGGGF